MKEVKIKAPAKINLSLDIKGIRKDGYHDLEMIMQSISLYDIIYINKIDKGIKLNTNDNTLPEGKSNLAYQAAKIILDKKGLNKGVEIFINKNIPIAAGLAGGSTDAAAVLKGINQLYQLKYNFQELKAMGREIGSDVPFCLRGGTALAVDRGDNIIQLPDISKENILIINPDIQVSTEKIYQKYDEVKYSLDIPTKKLVSLIKNRDNITWREGWNNILEPVTMEMVDDIKKIKHILKEKYNVSLCLMTGSGPTVYALINNVDKARGIINDWPRNCDSLFLTTTVKKDDTF